MVHKGRNREHRGRLNSFVELPENVQLIFEKIKREVNNELNENIDVYVYGSYLHGYWDEQSDFDVSIKIIIDEIPLKKKISELTGVKVDIFCTKNINSMILIP
jgi:predicted nucleotidyltransferase